MPALGSTTCRLYSEGGVLLWSYNSIQHTDNLCRLPAVSLSALRLLQLLSAMGVPGPPVRHGADVAAAAAAAAASGSGGSSGGCVPVLAYVQVVLGLVLPAFVMYCFEVRVTGLVLHSLEARGCV